MKDCTLIAKYDGKPRQSKGDSQNVTPMHPDAQSTNCISHFVFSKGLLHNKGTPLIPAPSIVKIYYFKQMPTFPDVSISKDWLFPGGVWKVQAVSLSFSLFLHSLAMFQYMFMINKTEKA